MTAAVREELLAELEKLPEENARLLLTALRRSPAIGSLRDADAQGVLALVAELADASEQLSALVDQALAGEEVIIGREGRPLVRLVPCAPGPTRRPGALRGQIHVADDFDELPDELAAAFGVPGR